MLVSLRRNGLHALPQRAAICLGHPRVVARHRQASDARVLESGATCSLRARCLCSWHRLTQLDGKVKRDGLRPATCLSLASGARAGSIKMSHVCLPIFRETELLPVVTPPAQALLRSQSGTHAAAWLGAVPSEAGTTLALDHMLIALQRPRCRAHGHGCGAAVDVYGDYYAASRKGVLAR